MAIRWLCHLRFRCDSQYSQKPDLRTRCRVSRGQVLRSRLEEGRSGGRRSREAYRRGPAPSLYQAHRVWRFRSAEASACAGRSEERRGFAHHRGTGNGFAQKRRRYSAARQGAESVGGADWTLCCKNTYRRNRKRGCITKLLHSAI